MHNLTLIDGAPGDAMVERAMRFKPGKDLGSVFMKKFARCGFFVCALLSAWCTDALAVIININANTNWSAITTGSGVGGQPNSTDNIIVLRGATLTVDVGNGQCASIQLGRDTGGVGQRGNGTLLFNAASQVTVSGIVTLGDNTNGGNRTGSITMTAGGTLILTGFTVNVFGAWTPGNGTVELSATNTLPRSNRCPFDGNPLTEVVRSSGQTARARTLRDLHTPLIASRGRWHAPCTLRNKWHDIGRLHLGSLESKESHT